MLGLAVQISSPGMPCFYIRMPGFESWLHVNMAPGEQLVMAQVAGFLRPIWETWISLQFRALA